MSSTVAPARKPGKRVIRLSDLPPEVRQRIVRRKQLTTLFSTIVMILGIGLISYPFVAGWWHSLHQATAINEYTLASTTVDPEPYLKAARQYNAQLDALQMTDPYAAPKTGQDDPYWKLLRVPGTDVMARVTLPGVKTDLPVYHGTSAAALQKGAGHLYGSSLPVGGPGTHTVISAHSGMPEARMFDRLHKMKKGDVFVITTLGQQLVYEVEKIQVIKPEDGAKALILEPGRDLATLVTCTPYGVNSHRLLVTGHRIPGTPADNGVDVSKTGVVESLWWLLPLLGALFGAAGFGIMQYRKLGGRAPGRHVADKENRERR